MVILVCGLGGRVIRNSGSVDYVDEKFAMTEVTKWISLLQLKKIVSEACWLNDVEVDIDLNLRMFIDGDPHYNDLFPFDSQAIMNSNFEVYKGDYMEIYVTTRAIQIKHMRSSVSHVVDKVSQNVPIQSSATLIAEMVSNKEPEMLNLTIAIIVYDESNDAEEEEDTKNKEEKDDGGMQDRLDVSTDDDDDGHHVPAGVDIGSSNGSQQITLGNLLFLNLFQPIASMGYNVMIRRISKTNHLSMMISWWVCILKIRRHYLVK